MEWLGKAALRLLSVSRSAHGHVETTSMVRSSQYFNSIPALAVECAELDGDAASTPVIFEDVFCETPPIKQCASRLHASGTAQLFSPGEWHNVI